MPSGSVAQDNRNLAGWVLIESKVNRQGRHQASALLVETRSRPGHIEEIPLPIFLDGRIHEVVQLPGDLAKLDWRTPASVDVDPRQLRIRPIGWVERNVRMAVRVLRTYRRIAKHQRQETGITFWRALHDLPGAYRAATAFRAPYPGLEYADWIKRFDSLQWPDTVAIQSHMAQFTARPRIHLLVIADAADGKAARASLTSLSTQLYRDFTCTVLETTDAAREEPAVERPLQDMDQQARVVPRKAVPVWLAQFNAMLAAGGGEEWVMLLHAGDRLSPHALYWFASEMQAKPGAAVIYCDDDHLDAEGNRVRPRFKPDWSPAHLRATNYIGSAAVLRGSALIAAGGVSLDCCRHGNYDLLLRVVEAVGEEMAHIPAVLFHRGSESQSNGLWEDPQWCVGMALAHLARRKIAADVSETLPGCRRIRYRLPADPPLVTLVVPTRDRPDLLRECINSVRGKTSYPRFEIVVFDNQTTDPRALAYLKEIEEYPGVRVLRYEHPFNYSTINNIAAREARGEVLCLLNNDTWVISTDWLEEMVGHLLQDRVGAVGAKLYYPDTRIQHAGVAVGPGGCADHLHIGLGNTETGYCHRAVVAQELSAVTGACLVTWKRLYQELGGLDERNLTFTHNDVDYCLRLQEAGYRVIFTPHAELFHYESATRGRDGDLQKRMRANREVHYMIERWGERMRNDPYYNPNLSYQRPDFSLSETPRVKKPWAA